MFERRLKIFLIVMLAATLGLLVRAAKIQVVGHAKWEAEAAKMSLVHTDKETTRGQILDAKGRVLAVDEPCTDACVDYRAIVDPPSDAWVASQAKARLAERGVKLSRLPVDQRKKTLDAEKLAVIADIKSMWALLASRYEPGAGDSDPQVAIEDIRQEIVQQVTMNSRAMWYRTYSINQKKATTQPVWEKWLGGESSDGPDMSSMPAVQDDEQTAHVILSNISQDTINVLGKQAGRFPWLVLRAGTHREYPMNEVACHLLGRMGRVSEQEMDASKSSKIPFRSSDLIGRLGVEKLCEPLLHGQRGSVTEDAASQVIVDEKDAVAGTDVKLTIDAAMQGDAQNMLKHVCPYYGSDDSFEPAPGFDMHGAIVMIDVKTSEVIVLASNPGFDANVSNDQYAAMEADTLNGRLRNRATCDALEPGSSVKPMVGLAAITSGALKPLEGIECTGYLLLPMFDSDGKPEMNSDGSVKKERELHGRCWVASEYSLPELLEKTKTWEHPVTSFAHHQIPTPHRGHDGNADGFLTYSDALERSCNVFFETVADRLSWPGQKGLAYWYSQFGLGRPTEIGIEEASGILPGKFPVTPTMRRMANCLGGIGEQQVWATPLQIANEAATIARGGVWMRPRLLAPQTQAALDRVRLVDTNRQRDQVDLHLSPAGLEQARIGMEEVVNDPPAGSGSFAARKDMIVAGKTGTAEGTPLRDWGMDENGEPVKVLMQGANRAHPITGHEWYRSKDSDSSSVIHAWFMGYAPANDPQIAFCVLVEYAGEGSGNGVAGTVVKQLLEDAVQQGYLHPTRPAVPMAANFSN
jgi:penicillin-binding protein 2